MNVNTAAIDDAVLALLHLTLHDLNRAWKGFDWDSLNRLYERGLIGDPVNKTKSVILTDDGLRESDSNRSVDITLRASSLTGFVAMTTSSSPLPTTSTKGVVTAPDCAPPDEWMWICSCSLIHLRSKFALMPCLSARPATDTP